ncbi:aminotransferase class IV [Rhodopirellula baltica]|uniref:Branched-chain amino acid aminotransferase n=1 Tax=Rhodopirellula baltica WH47 TaxID=991778 RepID=F2AMD0_RHOBT|nr:aminotransferase class IV [Rhodopirellula baltica]EGF29175.1 branched-chain amino acid aminotransferase [Rhodopirellula baltica WH47]
MNDRSHALGKANIESFAKHTAYFCCPAWGVREWRSFDQISLPISDLGFRQGVTAVERLRTYGGMVFCAEQHLLRLRETLRLLKIENGPSTGQLERLIEECLKLNAKLVRQVDVGMTIWVTAGSSKFDPTWAVHLNAIDHEAVANRQMHGQPIVITSVVQPPMESWPRQAKVRNRLHYYLADLEAKQVDPDATGMLLDLDGSVTESSVANVAIVCEGRLVVPPVKKVLKGVTLDLLRGWAIEHGIRCLESPLMPDDLHAADEILLAGTDTGVWFASKCGQGESPRQRGAVCRMMQQMLLRSANRPNSGA